MQEQPDPIEDVYKQLYLACHDYHFGKITFLEMLRRWQDILQIPPQQDQAQQEKS